MATIPLFDFNMNIFRNKKQFVHLMVSDIRSDGGVEFWVFNTKYLEIYHFKATRISEFDVQIDLNNALENQHVHTAVFVLHMKNNILAFLNEVPGIVYMNKLECYRALYEKMYTRAAKTKIQAFKDELIEKINYVESEFPQLII